MPPNFHWIVDIQCSFFNSLAFIWLWIFLWCWLSSDSACTWRLPVLLSHHPIHMVMPTLTFCHLLLCVICLYILVPRFLCVLALKFCIFSWDSQFWQHILSVFLACSSQRSLNYGVVYSYFCWFFMLFNQKIKRMYGMFSCQIMDIISLFEFLQVSLFNYIFYWKKNGLYMKDLP